MLAFLGSAFLGWSAITLLWTANLPDGLNELIQWIILALAFVLGARLNGLDRIFKGLALGILFSSLIVAIPLLQEYFPHEIVSIQFEGLFGNRNMLAEATVLTAIGCIGYRAWWYLPGLSPAIFVAPISRGAILGGLAAFGYWLWTKSRIAGAVYAAAICTGTSATVFITGRTTSLIERIEIWKSSWRGVSFFGHGLGSFFTLFPFLTSYWDTVEIRPDHAHNDILELAFETGIIGVCLYVAILAIAYRMADTVQRSILVAFLTIGMFAMPWHMPTTAFICALLLGHISTCGARLRRHDIESGAAFCSRDEWLNYAARRTDYSLARGGTPRSF